MVDLKNRTTIISILAVAVFAGLMFSGTFSLADFESQTEITEESKCTTISSTGDTYKLKCSSSDTATIGGDEYGVVVGNFNPISTAVSSKDNWYAQWMDKYLQKQGFSTSIYEIECDSKKFLDICGTNQEWLNFMYDNFDADKLSGREGGVIVLPKDMTPIFSSISKRSTCSLTITYDDYQDNVMTDTVEGNVQFSDDLGYPACVINPSEELEDPYVLSSVTVEMDLDASFAEDTNEEDGTDSGTTDPSDGVESEELGILEKLVRLIPGFGDWVYTGF